jgi:hypothetical protein
MEENFKKDGGSWKKFKIADLFEVVGTKSLDEGKLTFLDEGINFIGRVNENNGIKGKIKKQSFTPNKKFTITATVIGNYKYVKYQEEDYYCSQNINKLIPKFNINKNIALYIITSIKKFVERYNGQQGGYKLDELSNFKIYLPVQKEGIAFNFMEAYVSEFEEESVNKLVAYLKVSGFENYQLNENEKKALNSLKNGKIRFKDFMITDDIFIVKNTNSILKSEIIENSGLHPYVTAGSKNNSIQTYISYDKNLIEKGNSIMIGGKSMVITYQNKDYYSNDSHNLALYPINKLAQNEIIQLFLVVSLKKSLIYKYHWGDSISKKKIKKDIISLPINDKEEIDYIFMETYVKAIEKISIKSLIEYKNEIIKSIKKIVRERKYYD